MAFAAAIPLIIAGAQIAIPFIVDLINSGKKPDGTALTQEEIKALQAFVDSQHEAIQGLEG